MTLTQAKFTTVFICSVVILAMLGVAWWHIESSRQQILEDNALVAARSYASTFENLRSFYTSEVVARIPGNWVTVSHDYKDFKFGIPLPATLTIKLAEKIGQQTDGFSVKLYSDYPFPWRAQPDQLNEFEKRALRKLADTPGEPYYEFEQSTDGGTLHYAVADLMRPACVSCHNSHPQSPKRDWEAGDLRGVLAVSVPMRGAMDTTQNTFDYLLICFIAGGIIIITTVTWVLGKHA
jgi:hypothetical protein